VAYTGTHDNNTARGWFDELPGAAREQALRYLRSDGRSIHQDLTRAVFASEADLSIVPAQDLLRLGSEGRMNRPGVAAGNWTWRLPDGALTDEVLGGLDDLTRQTGRVR
jgi:4-alpha-glucanotransferase